MKVSIGAYIKEGPWGGGNLFFENLRNYLNSKGHRVINHLLDDDIDVILLTDPRQNSESSAFTDKEIIRYKNNINANVKVVHRINECDERKQTEGLNEFIVAANACSDATVFVSQWIKDLYLAQGFHISDPHVIMSGSNEKIFNKKNSSVYSEDKKMSIVTHHWSGNWNKGFDIYEKLDFLLDSKEYSDQFEFRYIGNLPDNFYFKNSGVIKPLSGLKLATELKKSHIYLTGSLNEPSGNHHIEGALCGLPILYIDSGALPEYCDNFGVSFVKDNFPEKLIEIKNSYKILKSNLNNYSFKSDIMCGEYEELFMKILNEKLELKYIKNKKNFIERTVLKTKNLIILNFYNLLKKNKLWK
jgi:hypothetical protein